MSNGVKVTMKDIEANILHQSFFQGTDLKQDDPTLGLITLCFLTLKNGYKVIGKSACADPKIFDAEKGRHYAREDALEQCWPLMGYELRTKLALLEDAGQPTGDICSLGQVTTHVGTKVVHAVPMTRKKWCDIRGWDVPTDEDPKDEGYLVQYVDGGTPNVHGFTGYISWSPKDVFDRAYGKGKTVESDSYIDRLQVEHDQLDHRLKKLIAFLASPGFQKLPEGSRHDLQLQASVMGDYLVILARRLKQAKG